MSMQNGSTSAPASGGRVHIGSSLLGLAILAAGAGTAVWLVKTKPKAKPRERPRIAPIVAVAQITPTNAQVVVEAMGTVVAADEVSIQAEVSGRIEWVNPELIEGGFVTNGAVLARIDDRDYRLALQQREAALLTARGELRIEQGRQDIALKEWELVNGGTTPNDLDRDLALRRPQREAAEAAVASAEAALAQAAVSLERSVVRAPFDAVVAAAPADVGDQAAPGAVLARLVGTDRYWVKASLRTDRLQWLRFPEHDVSGGSEVVIRTPSGGRRAGSLLRLAPELEPSGRMAQVLIAVADPLLRRTPAAEGVALLLGEFVNVEIPGARMAKVIRIPRTALRDGSQVWLLDAEGRLQVAPVRVLWGSTDEVFLEDDVPPGARMITSTLGSAVPGMSLSVEGESRAPGEGAQPARPPAGGAERSR